MNKSCVILLALLAVSTYAYLPVRTPRLDMEFDDALLRHDAIVERHSLPVRKISVHAAQIDYFNEIFSCAQGVAYGLQYSPQKKGKCYLALSASIASVDAGVELLK
jgi:hypothetical protein